MEELRQALSHDPTAQLFIAKVLVMVGLIFYALAT
jgi:hypothetical protein